MTSSITVVFYSCFLDTFFYTWSFKRIFLLMHFVLERFIFKLPAYFSLAVVLYIIVQYLHFTLFLFHLLSHKHQSHQASLDSLEVCTVLRRRTPRRRPQRILGFNGIKYSFDGDFNLKNLKILELLDFS